MLVMVWSRFVLGLVWVWSFDHGYEDITVSESWLELQSISVGVRMALRLGLI